ncbi:DUF3280 domain-containing protein [Mesorhizobium sp. LHD-90]|uniref:DUF3280 domain-containing protein n=1 Tax=Mesorhizobium sp. LHD-90 TaxID=3071414 RepID=UPI0027E0F6E8|nr:DUF3280 domain-containing protein [Mesorhizobium sp. LHD-90]MDQ6432970.1 DUF3280 domain-containing protein [Mesorhizobium sp. LHD-90]
MLRRRALPALSLMGIALLLTAQSASAAEPEKNIVVFDFEMMDTSAAAGLIPPDEHDTRYLRESTQAAKDFLLSTGGYKIVDPKPAADELAKAGALRDCNGCEAPIAQKLGGQLAMTGIVNRVSRTEYELLIKVVDAGTGAPVALGYSGLRMGANYSWPRGAKWVMEKRIAAKLPDK